MGQLQERYKAYREPQKYIKAGVYPYFREITSKQGTEVEMDGHHVLMFGSNAYTGLTGDERVVKAAKDALDKYGSGCAGSRFLNGTLDLHVQLEKELATFVQKDDTLCFSTGRREALVVCQTAALQTQRHGRLGEHSQVAALRGR